MRKTRRTPTPHLPKVFDWRGGRAEGALSGRKRRILKKEPERYFVQAFFFAVHYGIFWGSL